MNQVSAQVVVSAVVVYLLQKAKQSKLVPWLTTETPVLNRAVAIVAACLSSLGVHLSFDSAAGTLLITGLTLSNVFHFAWHWLTSFVSQQLIFQTAVQKQPQVIQINASNKSPAELVQVIAAAAGGKS